MISGSSDNYTVLFTGYLFWLPTSLNFLFVFAQYKLTCPCPLFEPDPQVLCFFLIHAKAELYALQLMTDVEGDTPLSFPLPVLPEEPASFPPSTPAVGAIPLLLCDHSPAGVKNKISQSSGLSYPPNTQAKDVVLSSRMLFKPLLCK